MAGFMGFPISSQSAMSAPEMSPMLRLIELRLREQQGNQSAQLDQQQMAQQGAMQRAQMGQQESQFSRGLEADRAAQEAQLGLNRERSAMEQAARQAELGLRTRELEESRRAVDERTRMQREEKEERGAKERAAEVAAADKQKRAENFSQTMSRGASIIAENLPTLVAEMEQKLGRKPTLEETYQELMAQTAQLQGDDRLAVQNAVQEWYDRTSKSEGDALDRDIKRKGVESLDESRRRAAEDRGNTALDRQIAALNDDIREVTAQLQEARLDRDEELEAFLREELAALRAERETLFKRRNKEQ